MSETSIPVPRRRRGLRWLVIIAVAIPLLWVGYWFAGRQIVITAFGNSAESLGAAGRDVACGNRALGGFPLRLDLDCGNLVFHDREAGTAITAARITATAPLYRPGRVDASITGPLTIEAPAHGLSLQASWEAATATMDAGFAGLNRATLAFDQVEIVPGAGENRTPFTLIGADRATVSALPGAGNDYRFTLDANAIAINPESGDSPPPAALDAAVTALDMGGSLGTNPGRTIAAWLADGGELQVDRFDLTMGDATAGVTGRLRATAEGVLSGELNVRIVGLDADSGHRRAPRPRLEGPADPDRRHGGRHHPRGARQPSGPRRAGHDPERRGAGRPHPARDDSPTPAVTATPRPSPMPCDRPKSGRRSPARPR